MFLFEGNPSKPTITGILNIPVGDTCKLTCSSTSTSAPDYYAKLVKLSYKWFVNGSDVQNSYRDIGFTVTKNDRYNQYSCEAIEKNLLSKRSDPVQINPLCKILSLNYYFDGFQNSSLTMKINSMYINCTISVLKPA